MTNNDAAITTETMSLVSLTEQDAINTAIPDKQRDRQHDLPLAHGMKVIVPVKAFKTAIHRANLAAFSVEGQSEIGRANNETCGHVRISAINNELVFESCVSHFTSRHIVPAGIGATAIIETEGEACVPAEEFKQITERIPSQCLVVLTFTSQPTDRVASPYEDIRVQLPNGLLSVGVIRENRLVASSSIESYPTKRFASAHYPDFSSLEVLLTGNAKFIKGLISNVIFSCNPRDCGEFHKKLAVSTTPDSVYLLGTDGRHASIARFDRNSTEVFFGTEPAVPILIDITYLIPVLTSISAKETISLATDKSGDHVYVRAGNTHYGIKSVDKAQRASFPNYQRLLGLPVGPIILVDRQELIIVVKLMRVVNKGHCLCIFTVGDGFINFFVRGDNRCNDATGEVPYKQVSPDPVKRNTIKINTYYLLKALEIMTCDWVRMTFTPNELKVRVEDEHHPGFSFFMPILNPNKEDMPRKYKSE